VFRIGDVAYTKELLAQIRDKIHKKDNSIRTEKAYVERRRRYIIIPGKRHIEDKVKREISQDLSRLASNLQLGQGKPNRAHCPLEPR
jgi:hypothetical protein